MNKKELSKMSTAELVKLYNKHSGKKAIKKFRTKAAAIGRTLDVMPKKVTTSRVTVDPKATTVPEGARRTPFDLKPAAKTRDAREGSMRAEALRLALRKTGATLQEIMDATEWPYRAAVVGIRLLHSKLGYGLLETETGKIHAFTK